MSTWVSVDGRLSPAASAQVPALDHGMTVGDGVFETCKVVEGTPFGLTRHLARLHTSAGLIGLRLPWDDEHLRQACAATIDAASAEGDVGRIRITVTGGPGPLGSDRSDVPPTLVIAAGPGGAWPEVTAVVTVPWTRNERSAVAGAKTTSYAENVVALAEAHRHGASEAILANTAGALCEGTGSNVFLEVDGVLATPALATGCLAGITRALVCEAVEVVERDDLTLDHLRATSEAFLTSSTRDVHPIATVDGVALAAAPGPRTAAAAAAFRALEAHSLDP
ncbi:aminotransferase class IV [Aquihabitans sp. McL0605]|uniref:aminotransferase class IV n=1 Tax=Aquihabitans sp. McL0605 TaxID=3415671 RepID=UPI003CEBA2F4